MKNLIRFLVIPAVFVFSLVANSRAAITPEQEMRAQELQQKDEKIRQKIEAPKKAPQVKEEFPVAPVVPELKEKANVKRIIVTGVTLLSEKEINAIIKPFENTQQSLSGLQKVADLITDAYRQKGYITSRAYLPPQKIQEGILEVRVMEGVTGEIQVKGNRYFKSALIRNKITLKKGDPFNYDLFRRDMSKINEQPDRDAKAVLLPGKEAGTTDVILEVKDRLPIHLAFEIDDFGSRYIDKYRYTVKFTDNNLLGLDDKLTFQYQLAQASRYYLKSLRYSLPIGNKWDAGLSAYFSRVKLGQELEDQDVRGRSKIYSLFTSRTLIDKDNLDLQLNLGFDYKDVTNYQLQTVTSHDKIRMAKIGFDLDISDNFGRTLITDEFGIGIPNIMGGLKKASATTTASRSGSGGNFLKNTINLLRLQKMPFSSTLLWKNQIQLSPYILTATEEFQIGGMYNVRGYGPAEAVGDNGYAMTWEWTFPPYFLPRKIKVPLSRAKVYDALRFAIFYDWANTRLRRPQAGEEKNKTLRGAGFGVRITLPEDFSARLDLGWPLDNTPSDSDHLHPWFQVSKSF